MPALTAACNFGRPATMAGSLVCTTTRAMLGLAWLRAVEVPLNVAYVGEVLRHALSLSWVLSTVAISITLPGALSQ